MPFNKFPKVLLNVVYKGLYSIPVYPYIKLIGISLDDSRRREFYSYSVVAYRNTLLDVLRAKQLAFYKEI
jgi:hypothetical protein